MRPAAGRARQASEQGFGNPAQARRGALQTLPALLPGSRTRADRPGPTLCPPRAGADKASRSPDGGRAVHRCAGATHACRRGCQRSLELPTRSGHWPNCALCTARVPRTRRSGACRLGTLWGRSPALVGSGTQQHSAPRQPGSSSARPAGRLERRLGGQCLRASQGRRGGGRAAASARRASSWNSSGSACRLAAPANSSRCWITRPPCRACRRKPSALCTPPRPVSARRRPAPGAGPRATGARELEPADALTEPRPRAAAARARAAHARRAGAGAAGARSRAASSLPAEAPICKAGRGPRPAGGAPTGGRRSGRLTITCRPAARNQSWRNTLSCRRSP